MREDVQILNEIEKAAKLCEKSYTHTEIINMLKTENDFEKQICILKLEIINSQEEADLLVFQLTGHHGLIREAAAIKINEIILNGKYTNLFLNTYAIESLLKAVNDINPNICRLICAALPVLLEHKLKEKNLFLNKLYKRFEDVFDELERLKRSNMYTKKLFNLYWCLEALGSINPEISTELESVLDKSAGLRDYTIREKTAMVLSVMIDSSDKIERIKEKLKADENFYVKRYSKTF